MREEMLVRWWGRAGVGGDDDDDDGGEEGASEREISSSVRMSWARGELARASCECESGERRQRRGGGSCLCFGPFFAAAFAGASSWMS